LNSDGSIEDERAIERLDAWERLDARVEVDNRMISSRGRDDAGKRSRVVSIFNFLQNSN
jgi:hypothetical protein